jgi:hypothetical protein
MRFAGLCSVFLIGSFLQSSSGELTSSKPAPFAPGRVGFSVKFKDETSSYRVRGVFVLPRSELSLEVVSATARDRFEIEAKESLAITQIAPRIWSLKAPSQVGLYPVKIRNTSTEETMLLNVFVLVRFREITGEYLNGYRIGSYPKTVLKGLTIYEPPKGFVEVTRQNADTLVAPHFRLGQFLCKQEGDYPKYLILKERLLLKLELILEKVNERGYRCDTFYIMSGYRTPYYNRAIGNVRYSRHVWGGAADIFVDDDPRDGMMDDLNKDGKIDYRDAAILYDIIDEQYGRPFYALLLGGLGRYKRTAAHGPFVHVDVRGFRARWGQ